MPVRPLTPTPETPGALTAFLRGVERRGLVFAALQAGDPAAGDAALAEALRDFAARAAGTPFADWPRRFWTMLLATPALRGPARPARHAGALAVLDGLGSGPRAALLLRLVAGLSGNDAAAVLGVSPPTYRMALQRALPRLEDGSADAERWRRMGEAAREAIRTLPPERLERLGAQVPATAVDWSGYRRGPGPAPPVARAWRLPAMLLALLLTLAALAATWWWPLPG